MKDTITRPKGKFSSPFSVLAVAACIAAFTPSTLWAADPPSQQSLDLPQVVTEAAAPAGMPVLKETTHPTIKLSPDDTELVRLDDDAGLVVVGNPEHANVIADSTRTLVVIPRKPGATYFTVMNTGGNIIMRRLIIVAGPEEHYVRVKNSCRSGGSKDCNENNIYYCPDTCHKILIGAEEVSVDDRDVQNGQSSGKTSGASGPDNSSNSDDGSEEEGTEE
ncbi:MAG: pilus assembly protein N-terminal domain-containing protein [Alphaproteobacteria bacterium]|nr:pilus assembly protein N-terminal domain-containing protein [Alphaproteobacteria bacterium]MCB9975765.1 pilus assembly protein N-terminal domain-containing protein [Rhodospirillales bacterium]